MLSERPKQRILTLQMGRDDLRIGPGEPNYKASVTGTIPDDALLVSLFPHMRPRAVQFDFDITVPNGEFETLLKVRPYRTDWQSVYILKARLLLRKGTVLRCTGTFDNSAKNSEQSSDAVMIGYFDVAVDPAVDKSAFVVR